MRGRQSCSGLPLVEQLLGGLGGRGAMWVRGVGEHTDLGWWRWGTALCSLLRRAG